jgi:uncharacterized protein (DUF1778 family)
MKDPRHPLALRIPTETLKAIDARAKRSGFSRTEYMIRASLGEITDPRDADSRLALLEERVEALERWQNLST